MEMTSREIKSRFLKNPTYKELQILAELNLCTRYDICHVLVTEGAMEKDHTYIRRAKSSADADTARIAEQAQGISELRATSPARCQPGKSAAIWESGKTDGENKKDDRENTEDIEHTGKEVSEDAERMEANTAAKETEEAGTEQRDEKADTVSEYIVDALIFSLDKIESELRAIDQITAILEAEKHKKEEEYRKVCSRLGIKTA